MSPALVVLALVAAAEPAPAAEPLPFHPRFELGFGLGVVNEEIGLIPRLRGGATLEVGIPQLVLGGDLAGEAMITGDDGEGITGQSYWEAVLTPRMFVGYAVPLSGVSFVPYGYLAISGGFRNTTRRFFGREDTTTDVALGGRLGLGLGLHIQMLIVALELDAGWKDLGPAGSATVNVGATF
jgi:hypothetical protein